MYLYALCKLFLKIFKYFFFFIKLYHQVYVDAVCKICQFRQDICKLTISYKVLCVEINKIHLCVYILSFMYSYTGYILPKYILGKNWYQCIINAVRLYDYTYELIFRNARL